MDEDLLHYISSMKAKVMSDTALHCISALKPCGWVMPVNVCGRSGGYTEDGQCKERNPALGRSQGYLLSRLSFSPIFMAVGFCFCFLFMRRLTNNARGTRIKNNSYETSQTKQDFPRMHSLPSCISQAENLVVYTDLVLL